MDWRGEGGGAPGSRAPWGELEEVYTEGRGMRFQTLRHIILDSQYKIFFGLELERARLVPVEPGTW